MQPLLKQVTLSSLNFLIYGPIIHLYIFVWSTFGKVNKSPPYISIKSNLISQQLYSKE